MFTQAVPSAAHRCHRQRNVLGAPVHVPLWAVRIIPFSGVPVIVGRAVFVGAAARAATAVAPATTRAINGTISFEYSFIWSSFLPERDLPVPEDRKPALTES
jgi:hypothetical protein